MGTFAGWARAAVLLGAIAGLIGGFRTTPSAQGPAAGAEAIKAVADAYVKATLAGDAKAVAALYTEDAVEMPPNAAMIRGRMAIEQHYQEVLGSMKMTAFSLTHLESHAVGDRGYDVGTYQQSMTPAGAGPASDSGKYTVILKRSGNAWKVAYAIYNSDQPVPQR